MFVSLKFLMDQARKSSYSITRIAVTNLESIEAVTQAAVITDSPIVYDIYEPELKNICQSCLEYLIQKLGSEASIPVAMFSDHVQNVSTCKEIVNKGYGGLMIDASRFPFEENVRMTKEVTDYAHKYGIFVEGALGIIESGREEEEFKTELTDPKLACEFVRKTDVDCLAISIGVKSGFYQGSPQIDYELLREIRNKIDIHLSLHGCSGLSEETIKKCIKSGISFTAWATDVRYAFFKKIDELRAEKGKEYVCSSDILIPARDKMKDEIINKIMQTGSNDRGSELISLYKKQGILNLDSNYPSSNNKKDIDKLVDDITNEVLIKIKKF